MTKLGWVAFDVLCVNTLAMTKMRNLLNRIDGISAVGQFTIFFVEGRGPVVLSCWKFFSFVYRAIVPTKFALKLTDVVVQTRNRQKCPRLRGREFPNFCRPFSNLGHFRKCGKVWLNSVQKPPSLVFEEGVKYNGLQCIRTSWGSKIQWPSMHTHELP